MNQISRNPFRYLKPVRPEDFYGRWPLVKRVAFDLSIEGGDSHAFIAGRRCGKSSILEAIEYQLIQQTQNDIGDWHTLPLLLDLKRINFESSEEFFAIIIREIIRILDTSNAHHTSCKWPRPVNIDAEFGYIGYILFSIFCV